jgi:hypothetical protein
MTQHEWRHGARLAWGIALCVALAVVVLVYALH